MLDLSRARSTLTRTNLSSLFSKAVATSDAGAALAVQDVLNAAIGLVAPIYGGVLLERLGVGLQPHLSCAHYLVLLVLALATIARRRQGPSAKDKALKEP